VYEVSQSKTKQERDRSNFDAKLLLEQLKLTLPAQPPPRISSRGKLLTQN